MNKPTTILARSTAGALTTTGLVAAAVVGVQHAGAAPSSSTSTSTVADHPSKAQKSPRCHRPRLHVGKAPEALKADLLAARQKVRESDATGATKRAERREAIATIRKGVLDGKYGEQVRERAQKRAERVEERRASLPEKLRTDLAALEKMKPGADRREAARKIREGRLDGTYGERVQQHAKKAQKKREQRKQTCQERREQRKASDRSPAQG